MRKPRSKVTSFRFTEDFYARLREHADEDEHSVNELIVRVLSAWMDGKRYEPLARPLDSASQAKLDKANAPYRRPRGRPMTASPLARQEWLQKLIPRLFPADGELLIDEATERVTNGRDYDENFPRSLERNLFLAGFRPMIRASDEAVVWLGPEHTAILTE